MANRIDVEYDPVEGVHHLDDSSYRKHNRSLPVLECENCKKRHGEQGVDVKRCQGCWSVGFCSKDCQLALWPSHKAQCRTLEAVLVLEHLARNVYSNPFLLHYLRVALILKLNPDINSLPSSAPTLPKPDECLSLFVHMRMHPLSSEHAAKLYLGHIDTNGKEKIPGHLTLSINSEPAEQISLNGPKTLAVRTWKKARRNADDAGKQDNPILMVNFGYDKDYITSGIELTPDAFATARGNPAPGAILSAVPPGMELPTRIGGFRSIFTDIIDKYIEHDEEDKLKLRRDLRKADKMFLRQVALTS